MLSANYLPQVVECEVSGAGAGASLDATAKRSEDGKKIVLQVVNPGDREASARIDVTGFTPSIEKAEVTELAAGPEAVNTAEAPDTVVPRHIQWTHGGKVGSSRYAFPPHSFTIMRFE
jgi:alpha-L-arabinofuranosidase